MTNKNQDPISLEEAARTSLPAAAQLAQRFTVEPNQNPASQEEYHRVMGELSFGVDFSDHMASAQWTQGEGWTDLKVTAYGPLQMNPGCAVLHYGQEVFEGVKAYKHADGSIWTFRPAFNAARINQSARRLALPELPVEDFVGSLAALVKQDAKWVPEADGSSLYLRPFMYADEDFLGVRSSHSVRYLVIASPSGAYFKNGSKPVSIWVDDEYHRAGPGGTGDAKTGGNYASSLLPQILAAQKGYDQVCFLDTSFTYLEELGGMNVFVVKKDGSVRTPALTGTILEGGTRGAIKQLLQDQGREVVEEQIALKDLLTEIESGEVAEMFACGTAAVVTQIGKLGGSDFEVELKGEGEMTHQIHDQLTNIQYGKAEDPHGWMYRLV